MHTITTRVTAPDEQQIIAARAKPDVASFGCLAILFGIAPALLFGTLGWWLGGFVSPLASKSGIGIGMTIATILFVSMLVPFIRDERRRRRRAQQDHQAQLVQDIHVSEARVIEIRLINDNEPILAFDIGENKVLYLQGQWLRTPETYGAEPLGADPSEEFINGLSEPRSFPSTQFTVTRFPHSGEVVGIRVTGTYLAPETEVDALRFEYNFSQSEIFEGALEDIAGILAREHERRNAQDSSPPSVG